MATAPWCSTLVSSGGGVVAGPPNTAAMVTPLSACHRGPQRRCRHGEGSDYGTLYTAWERVRAAALAHSLGSNLRLACKWRADSRLVHAGVQWRRGVATGAFRTLGRPIRPSVVRAVVLPVAACLVASTLSVILLDRGSVAKAATAYGAWSWGYGATLGDGSGSDRNTPGQIPLSSVKKIDGGGGTYEDWWGHTVVLTEDGTAHTWGWNSAGQLGNGSTIRSSTPVRVLNLAGLSDVSAGGAHTLALRSDGTVWAWGSNSSGQLGNGTTTNSSVPAQLGTLSGVRGIAAGNDFSLALKTDGTVWAWGANASGQLGNGTTTRATTPVAVSNLPTINGVTAGEKHTVAWTTTGEVWGWGDNRQGQLANGTSDAGRSVPGQISGLTGIIKVSADAEGQHNLALRGSDGTAWAWGSAWSGEIGNGYVGGNCCHTPTRVPLEGVQEVAAGGAHSYASLGDGTVWAWGSNRQGQLGDGRSSHGSCYDGMFYYDCSSRPVPVNTILDMGGLGAGGASGYAAKATTGSAAVGVPVGQTYGYGGSPHGPTTTGYFADPVNTATGAYTTTVEDFSLPGIGMGISLERSYSSNDPAAGPLGPGWTHSYATDLTIAPNGDATFRAENGRQLRFALTNGSYVAGPGVRDSLVSSGGTYELTRKDRVKYGFDSAGRLTFMRDRNGQGPQFGYDGAGRLATVSAQGRTVTFSYEPVTGLLSQAALSDGRSVGYAYTEGRLTSVRDLRGNTTTYTYDAAGRLASVRDQNQHDVVRNTYGADGRVTEQLDARGGQTRFGWDAATQTASVTDARGNVWRDVYSNNVLLRRVDPLGNTTAYDWDAYLNVTQLTDPRNKATTMTYDSRGNLLTRTAPSPLSYVVRYTYDADDHVTSVTNGRNKTTTYGHDAAGNLTTITRPGGAFTTMTYDPAGTGLLVSTTDPRSKTTNFGYDGQGNRTSVTTPTGSITTFTYDSAGRVISVVEPRGNAAGANPDDYRTRYAYDEAGHRLSATDPLDNVTRSSFDLVGNLTSVTDAANRATSYTYDQANELTAVRAPDATATAYAYDSVGNLSARTDANGHATTNGYDAANRLTSVANPIGTWAYVYDPAGNRVSVTPPGNAGSINTSYDALNRPTSIDYPDATPDVTLAYDASDNRTAMTDGAGSVTYAYDDLDRLTGATRGADTFTYAYDSASNMTSRTYPDSTVTTYSYDDGSRLETATSGGQTTAYAYDLASNLLTATLPAGNGHAQTRSYDRAGRVNEVKNAKAGSTLSKSTYGYDPVGNPLTVIDEANSTTTHTYDALNRVTKACYATTSCVGATDFVGYSYDAVGNRLTESRPAGTTNYTYNPADQLTGQSGLNGTSSFAYDARGNQTSAGEKSYTYDQGNRLTSAPVMGPVQSYAPTVTGGNPLGYWRLGEASGTTAADASSNNRNGTYTNGPALNQPGLLTNDANKGVNFDGSNDYVALPSLPVFNTSFSVEAWVKPSTAPPAQQTIFGAHDATKTGRSLSLRVFSDGRIELGFYGDNLAAPAGTITFGSTSHVVATYDAPSDTSRIYVNDRLVATGSQGPLTSTAATFAIGRWRSTNLEPFKGTIDEVAVYPTALSVEQVHSRYRAGKALPSMTTESYSYDGDGRRLRASTGPDASQSTSYLWDPVGGPGQLAMERDGAAVPRRKYTYGLDRISMTSGAQTSFFHGDRLGSVLNVTSSTGVPQWSYRYDPYGNRRSEVRNDPQAPSNPMGFTGALLDATGLYHLQARQYDPSTGRFLSTDPMVPSETSPYVSPYAYVDNRPTVLVDPTGLLGESKRQAAMQLGPDFLDDYLHPKQANAWLRQAALHPVKSWKGGCDNSFTNSAETVVGAGDTFRYFTGGNASPNEASISMLLNLATTKAAKQVALASGTAAVSYVGAGATLVFTATDLACDGR